jgi:hypothetical protein
MPIAGKPTLSVDFDGCIHRYDSGWKGAEIITDPPVEGALAWIRKAQEHFTVMIFSTRGTEPKGRHAMREWFSYWARKTFPDEPIEWVQSLTFPTTKPAAHLTIDDRAITFNGDWSDPALDPLTLLAFKPWNRK